jgi:hypothetical protein
MLNTDFKMDRNCTVEHKICYRPVHENGGSIKIYFNKFRKEVLEVVNSLLLNLNTCLLRLRQISSMRSSRPNKLFIFCSLSYCQEYNCNGRDKNSRY